MSRFCSPQLFRQLTTLGEVSSRASSSHVLRAAKPSRLVASALHRSIAVRAHRRDYSTAFADHYFTEDSHADLEESDEPGPYTNMMKFPAKRAPRRTLIVRGFDPETTSLSEIKELMGGFGEITQMNLHGRSVCYVEYAQLSSARRALINHKSFALRIHDKPLLVNYAVDIIEVGEPCRALWVSGLDISTPVDLKELKETFDQFGDVENIILNRKGLPTCIVRYSCIKDADEAIKAHWKQRLHHRGLALQLRFSTTQPVTKRSPNPTLHISGFCGSSEKLLSYIPEFGGHIQDLFLSSPIGDEMARHDVFIKFDTTETAEAAMEILNRQLGIAAQFAWPKKPKEELVQQRYW